MKNTPRSRLLLLELMISLVVFVICSVVCISLLVYAKGMTRDSTDLTNAVYLAQSAAETLGQYENMDEAVLALGGGSNVRPTEVELDDLLDDTLQIKGVPLYYDENWRPDANGPICMTLTTEPDSENDLRTVRIHIARGDTPIYSLTASFVLPGSAAGGELDTGEVIIQ